MRPRRAALIPALRDRHGTATIARGSLRVCVRIGGEKTALHKLTRHLIGLSGCVRAMLAISHRSQQVALTRLRSSVGKVQDNRSGRQTFSNRTDLRLVLLSLKSAHLIGQAYLFEFTGRLRAIDTVVWAWEAVEPCSIATCA